MTELLEQSIKYFLTIWNNYNNMLSIQANELDNFIIIIEKLRQKNKLEIEEKRIFVELIDLIADTIYATNNCAYKYGTTYYQVTKKYNEPELNCCSDLINHFESEIDWDLENKYDIAFTKSLLKK